MKIHKIGFTGHRPDKLGGYSSDVLKRLVKLAISYIDEQRSLCRNGAEITTIYTGMALGWDTAVAVAALECKIDFVAVVPFKGQEKMWPHFARIEYHALLTRAAEVVTVSPGPYSPAKMHVRNEWIVDHCTQLCALWNGQPSGTSHCVNYAHRQNRPVHNLWEDWTAPDHVWSAPR